MTASPFVVLECGRAKRDRPSAAVAPAGERKAAARGPCDPWPGRVNGTGHGVMSDGRLAHVVAYEAAHGPVPQARPRLVVRHRCHVARCRNPDHLRLGTDKQNAEDRARAGRGANQHGAQTRVRDRRW